MRMGLGRGTRLRRLVVPAATATLLLAGVGATSAAAAVSSGQATCSGGNISGRYSGLLVTGQCQVPAGATLVVNGNVVVSGRHAVLLSEFAPAHVTINGDVQVQHGGLLAIGTLNEGSGCAKPDVATSIVNGDIVLNGALSLKLDCTTVNGDVESNHGGMTGFTSTCEETPPPGGPLNFVVKDNLINGDVQVNTWQGCWLGVIRNVVSGTVGLRGNHPADKDAMEVLSNTIGRDLACWANTPRPQAGDALGPTPPPPPYNLVGGHEFGQCRGL